MTPPSVVPNHLRVVVQDAQARTVCAQDLLRNRKVALKWATTRSQVQGLRREWTLLGDLSDRYAAQPIDLVVGNEASALMTSDWIEGEPFDRFLAQATATDQATAVMDALAGLDHLHGAGICHRDIRASNLMVIAGPEGPGCRWLDFEHATRGPSLDLGASSTDGGQSYLPQHDVRSFCQLLQYLLPAIPQAAATQVLKAFAHRADSVFYLDEMPHARAAWTLLKAMIEKARVPIPQGSSLVGNPRYVTNTAALRQWRLIVNDWERSRDIRFVHVHGPAGIGKRRFLTHAARAFAAEGAAVINLLDTANPDWSRLQLPFGGPEGKTGDERTIILLLASGTPDPANLNRLLAAGPSLLLLIVSVDGKPAGIHSHLRSGATVQEWRFEGFSARDWYRWIQASV
jgi:hypothetical protein